MEDSDAEKEEPPVAPPPLPERTYQQQQQQQHHHPHSSNTREANVAAEVEGTAIRSEDSSLEKVTKAMEDITISEESPKESDTQVFAHGEHPSLAFVQMQQMREDGKLCDVVLEVGDSKIHAHRLVLAASSTYFYSMFVRDMLESRQDQITLQGVDPEAMSLLVEFAYSSKLEITTANVQSLMTAASLFNFPAAFKATSKFLSKQLDPSNCIGIRAFAKTHGSSELVETATAYFLEHFMETVKNDEYVNLPAEDLAFMLDSGDLNVQSEEDVYHAVQIWLLHAPEERKKNLALLLGSVRLPLLSPAFLTQEVESNQFIRKSLECRDLLDEAKNYHLMHEKFIRSSLDRFQPRKSTVGLLFAIGGRGAVGEPFSSVECYNFRTNTWHEGPELKSRRRHVGVACLGNKIYAVGGHDGIQHLNSVECYDPKKGHWEFVESMKKLRRGIAVGVLGGPLYAVGGLDDVNCYRAVERYDPESNEWMEVASLRSPRGGVGVATLGRFLYAAGGNDGNTSLQTVEKYDPHINKWVEVAPMAKRRAGVGLSALNGYLYAAGGFDDASPLNTVERYDPDQNEWVFVQSMHICRGGVGLASLGGYLFAIGGHDGKCYLQTAEVYCSRTNSWSMVASMKTSRAGAGVVSCPPSTLTLNISTSNFSVPESLGSL